MNGDAATIGMEIERFNGPEMFDDAGEHVVYAASANQSTAFRNEGRMH